MTVFPLPYVLMVSDGVSMRTIHPAGLGSHREAVEAVLADLLGGGKYATVAHLDPTVPSPAAPPPAPKRTDAHPATLIQREIATTSGYSGNTCQSCGSFAMKRTGVCETCEACGSTSGGCS